MLQGVAARKRAAVAAREQLPDRAALVRGAQRGDRAARERLAEELVPVAYRFALQLLGNRDDAWDVCQEAMMRLLATLERFEAGRPVEPWLRRIVYNQTIDHRRRAKVRRAESLEDMGLEGLPDRLGHADSDQSRELLERELRTRIWRCLCQLQPAERDILVLREYQDLAYREIAELLDIPLGTVMSRLHTARRRLRDVLVAAGVVLAKEGGEA